MDHHVADEQDEDPYCLKAYYSKLEEFRINARDEQIRQAILKREKFEDFWYGFGGWFVTTTLVLVLMYVVRLFT